MTADTTLRGRITAALDHLHESGAVYALAEHERDRIADALLPLFAAEWEAAADTAEDVANALFAAYDTEQGNGAMAVAARLRARADTTPGRTDHP